MQQQELKEGVNIGVNAGEKGMVQVFSIPKSMKENFRYTTSF